MMWILGSCLTVESKDLIAFVPQEKNGLRFS